MTFTDIAPEIILKYDYHIPRYTSYPTAPHFKEITHQTYLKWLEVLPENEKISLYFHIPFCEKLCWYCGCNTQIINHYSPVEKYLDFLKKEILLIYNVIKNKNLKIHHIHFGGGSPTIIKPKNFFDLCLFIRKYFNIDINAEIAIEVDPRNIDENKIIAYHKSGVNRISFGVQDFDLNVQKLINRVQPFSLIEKAINLFKKHNINNINLDFIYGLPGQTIDIISKNISLIEKLNPDRIAFFGYAHVPWVKKYMQLIKDEDLPNAKERIELYNIISQKLQKIDYVAIGLDHFAKKNSDIVKKFQQQQLKRNFQGYSTDVANILIAMGISAISYLPNGYAQNSTKNIYYRNKIESGEFSSCKGIALDETDQMYKIIIDHIMCYMKINLNDIINKYQLKHNYFEKILKNLTILEKDGLIQINDKMIIINPKVPQITRIVASFFDQYFVNSNNTHSKAL